MRPSALVLLAVLSACDTSPDDDGMLETSSDHGASLDACDGLAIAERLDCLRATNDALAAEVLDETGSPAVAVHPLEVNRSFARTLCGSGHAPAECEADLEHMLGHMMSVYLEGRLEPPPRAAAFARCHDALHDGMLAAEDDLELTLAHLDFAHCVELVIATASPRSALADEGPHVADETCILLTARAGDRLTADRVLRCQADWQLAAFTIVQSQR